LDAAVELPIRSFGVDKAILLHRSDIGDPYLPISSRNVSSSFLDSCCLFSDDTIVNECLTSQAPKVLEDISSLSSECLTLCAAENVSSLACIPVVTPTGPKGILMYMRSTRSPFTVWEVELMCTIANHVATVLHLDHSKEIHTLSEIYPLLVRLRDTDFSSGDHYALMDKILGVVLTGLRADSGSILLCEESFSKVAASRGLQGTFVPNLRLAEGSTVSNRVIANRKPLLLHGKLDSEAFPDAAPRPEVASAMSIPLRGRRSVIGMLNINSTKPGHLFGEKDFALAQAIARHIAIAVENAKLHEAERSHARYLGSLYKIARTITSTLELETVLEMIMDRLQSLIASDVCAILLYDQNTGHIQLTSGNGIPDGNEQDFIDLIQPLVKQSPRPRRAIVIRDLVSHQDYSKLIPAHRLGLRSAVIAPLIIKHKVVGFVAAYRKEAKGFPPSIIRLLLGLSELAAIAIENARLYERQLGVATITYKELTPRRLDPITGFDLGCKYSPACRVGGDYYDVFKLDDHKYALVIADVSGKDITAAAYIAMCKHSTHALAPHILSPAALLTHMNKLIYEQTEPEAFISMFYAVLDTKRRKLTYATAGHPPALLLNGKTLEVNETGTPGILLGVVPNATFTEEKTSMNSGDVLLLYTDGLSDVLSQSYESAMADLEEALRTYRLKTAQGIADELHRLAATGHTGRSPDDIALIVLKKI
jgi:GAF domain-containing protein